MEARRIVVANVERAEAFGSRTAFRFDATGFHLRHSIERPGFFFRHESACDGATTNRGRPINGFPEYGFRIDASNYESRHAERR